MTVEEEEKKRVTMKNESLNTYKPQVEKKKQRRVSSHFNSERQLGKHLSLVPLY